jgi:hypothetical protein
MNQKQARIALTLIIPLVTLMVFSPALSVKALTSRSNSATNNLNIESTHKATGDDTKKDKIKQSIAQRQVTEIPKPTVVSCPPGFNGEPSTEDATSPDDNDFERLEQTPGLHGEVVVNGTCFPNGEDEPSKMEERSAEPGNS